MSRNVRVIFVSMIKNESKIIKRCIESTLGFADAICICDTGSTDNTVSLLQEYGATLQVPFKIFTEGHEWRNFGHNRTMSFQAAVGFCLQLGWSLEDTYALVLDADMQLRVLPSFNKADLKTPGYRIIQKAGNLEYYNTRFLKLSHPWKCSGVTHEYWDGYGSDQIGPDKIYIQDVGDGGCKSDKFERDVRLLEEGLRGEPNNVRYMFYLAQSYKDSGQKDKAIEMYKRRVEAGQWYEEVWYSMYTIMKLYAEKGMSPEAEMWGNKAYEFRKERTENLLYLCRHFKDKRQHHKAWHYLCLGLGRPKPNDLLFLEPECYEKGFELERAIIHDYVYPDRKGESVKFSLEVLNKYGAEWAYNNLQWFVQPLAAVKQQPLLFQQIGDFIPTSTSFVFDAVKKQYNINVRYVNYRIQPNGSYLMSEGGILDGGHPVRTENYWCVADKDFNIVSPLKKMQVADVPTNPARIKGMEDVRLFFNAEKKLSYIGTTSEFSYNSCIRQHIGLYNTDTGFMEKGVSVKPPYLENNCEKNWIPYKGNRMIYKWHPFEIGVVNPEGKLEIQSSQETPKFFSHLRGSTTLVEEDGFLWGLVHCVMYQQPRKYYHCVVKIDPKTDRVVGYTAPFYFFKNAIEYCLGFEKCGDIYRAIVSQNDSNPTRVEWTTSALTWFTL